MSEGASPHSKVQFLKWMMRYSAFPRCCVNDFNGKGCGSLSSLPAVYGELEVKDMGSVSRSLRGTMCSSHQAEYCFGRSQGVGGE